jgi:hypothetical protein
MSVEGEYVLTSASRAKGSTIIISSLQSWLEPLILSSQTLKAIPVVKLNRHMYQDMILSRQDVADWPKAYDIVVEGKADADITLENEVIWYTGRLWVPDIVDLSMIILPEEYDSKVAGHICQEKTTELVWRNFF